ncbi:hypothetical protein ZEAMMB73_Zm00001d021394 [Zea mays]|uniref:Uncharacterized protein n=1 Tax=Zea mays TaxID=4577 RepID=A0A1D6IAM5_MAIZE|nr:hypothetical protein ZEAMMB73_Zm00001d021394 [Zea mays]
MQAFLRWTDCVFRVLQNGLAIDVESHNQIKERKNKANKICGVNKVVDTTPGRVGGGFFINSKAEGRLLSCPLSDKGERQYTSVYYHRRMAETEKDIFRSMDESRFMVGGRFKKMTGSTLSIKKVMVKTSGFQEGVEKFVVGATIRS